MDVNYNKCSQKLGKKEALTKYTSFFPLKYKVLSNTYYKYILQLESPVETMLLLLLINLVDFDLVGFRSNWTCVIDILELMNSWVECTTSEFLAHFKKRSTGINQATKQ